MDSFQKRQRERRKIEKRSEKDARRKGRAELIQRSQAETERESQSPEGEPTSSRSIADSGRGAQETQH